MFFAAFRPTEIEMPDEFDVVTEELEIKHPDKPEELTKEVTSREVTTVTVESRPKGPERTTAEVSLGEGPKPTITMKIMVPDSAKPGEDVPESVEPREDLPVTAKPVEGTVNRATRENATARIHALRNAWQTKCSSLFMMI